jgi:hypothetical protein
MSSPRPERIELPPDAVIDAYKPGVDITLLRENLKLTPSERLEKVLAFAASMDAIRGAARKTSETR